MSEVSGLHGLRVLIVEDEFIVALLIEEMLGELGCTVAGCAARVVEALDMLERQLPNAAVLDVNLGGDEVYPVANALAEHAVPFIFSTGYGHQGVGEVWRNRPILQKPFRREQLADALKAAIANPVRL